MKQVICLLFDDITSNLDDYDCVLQLFNRPENRLRDYKDVPVFQ